MTEILESVIDFIRPELVILIAVLIIGGWFLKSAPGIPDWSIPFVLLLASIVITTLYVCSVLGEGYSLASMVTAFIQAVLISGMAVYGNQVYKQIRYARSDTSDEDDSVSYVDNGMEETK